MVDKWSESKYLDSIHFTEDYLLCMKKGAEELIADLVGGSAWRPYQWNLLTVFRSRTF